jgi:hypothetical protein
MSVPALQIGTGRHTPLSWPYVTRPMLHHDATGWQDGIWLAVCRTLSTDAGCIRGKYQRGRAHAIDSSAHVCDSKSREDAERHR